MQRFMYALLGILFMFSCGLGSSLWAEEPVESEEDDVQILAWKVPRKGAAKLLPNISLIGAFSGAYFRNDPSGDQGENPSRTGFNLQAIEVAFQAVIDPYIRADVFLLFSEDGVEVEDATFTTLSLPGNLQIRGGKMLAKFGRQNTLHIERWNFVDQSLANRFFFGPEGFSELGLELSILFPLPWFSELSFEWLNGDNDVDFNGPSKADFVYLGHWKNFVELTDYLGLQIGLSGTFGKNESDRFTQIYGADIYLRWRPSPRQGLKWITEYYLRRFGDPGGALLEGGLYSQLIWQFARRWETGIRFDFIGIPEEQLRQQGLAPMVAFLASEYFRVKAQYEMVRTPGQTTNHEAFLQVIFNMGPHGAHVF
jgi:hypothetical protein